MPKLQRKMSGKSAIERMASDVKSRMQPEPDEVHTLSDLSDQMLTSMEGSLVEHGEDDGQHDVQLTRAFHHMQRAGAVISLLEQDTSTDLRELLKHGIDLYKNASGTRRRKASVNCAFGLLRAAEHLGMAGLYQSRSEHRVEVAPPPRSVVAQHLAQLTPRLDHLNPAERANGRRLEFMARELLRRAENASHDPHLEYELTMAADGICMALEEGL